LRRQLDSRTFWLLMAALLVVSATKHVLTFCTGPAVIENDALEYWERGLLVRDGDWLQLGDDVDYRTPLYPIFLGIMQRLFGSNALCATVIAQHLMHMASSFLVAWTCWLLTGSRLVTLSGYALSVSCVTRVWYANVTLAGPLFMLMMTATLAWLAAYYRRPSAWRMALTGACLATATLVRPIPQMLWLPLFGLVLLMPGVRPRDRLRHAFAAIAAMALVLSPAMARNHFNHDAPYVAKVPPINKWVVCFHDRSAANLPIPDTAAGRRLLELVPDLKGTFDSDLRNGYRVLERLEEAGLSDREIDQLVTATCYDAVRANPGVFTWKAFKRLGNFWRTSVQEYPYYSTYDFDDPEAHAGQHTWRIEPFASWYEVVLSHTLSNSVHWLEIDFVACMLGTLLLIRRRETRFFGLSLAVVFIYFPVITALLEVESYRYRRVLEPYIVVAIVAGLVGHWESTRRRNEREPMTFDLFTMGTG
jgi:4-amino-4-deoxy-L-arabinose transferase-like glycosyltransferase